MNIKCREMAGSPSFQKLFKIWQIRTQRYVHVLLLLGLQFEDVDCLCVAGGRQVQAFHTERQRTDAHAPTKNRNTNVQGSRWKQIYSTYKHMNCSTSIITSSTSWLLFETQRASVPLGLRRHGWLCPGRKWKTQDTLRVTLCRTRSNNSDAYLLRRNKSTKSHTHISHTDNGPVCCTGPVVPSLKLWPVWFHWHQKPEPLMGCRGLESC